MNEFKLVDTETGNERYFDERAKAEEEKEELERVTDANLELERVGKETDGGPEVVEEKKTTVKDSANHNLPDKPPVDTDPLTWIPDEFQDTIDGSVAINRKGFEVLAQHYNIATQTDMVELSSERVVHKATAETEDGRVYTAYGEAHSAEDKDTQLVRMSDTRAYKRAVSRATGIGMIAVEELKNEL